MPEKIKIAIVGLGNAASALIQGIQYYRDRKNGRGLLRPTLAGYHVSDIDLVAAIDISEKKVGKTVFEAIHQNELDILIKHTNKLNRAVVMGKILDGVIPETQESVKPAKLNP
ncbi:MAG: inositol-3-phosphate synthase, partial [Candidatus Heimdallarchaeota archaeon]